MKSRLLSAFVLVSILLSSASLAYQIKNSRSSSRFAKYNVPLKQTELEHKLELADVNMIQEMSPMRQGIGIARVWAMTDNNSHVVVRIFVSEKNLPSGYDERKKAIEEAAYEAAFAVTSQFGKDEISLSEVSVEFRSIEDMVHNNSKNYAIFANGELTFH
jgi:hypothetical protein